MSQPKDFKTYSSTKQLEEWDLYRWGAFQIYDILTEEIPKDNSGYVQITVTQHPDLFKGKEGRKYICSLPTRTFNYLAKLSQGSTTTFGISLNDKRRLVYNLISEEQEEGKKK